MSFLAPVLGALGGGAGIAKGVASGLLGGMGRGTGQALAGQAQFSPFDVMGPMGGVQFSDGRAQLQLSPEMEALRGGLLGQAGGFLGCGHDVPVFRLACFREPRLPRNRSVHLLGNERGTGIPCLHCSRRDVRRGQAMLIQEVQKKEVSRQSFGIGDSLPLELCDTGDLLAGNDTVPPE